jgi:DNA-binding MarR family transcriptional regulator
MMGEPEPPNLLDSSRWRPLWHLLNAMDQDIASLYDEAGAAGMRPRFVGPHIQLDRHGPMTIRELADRIQVTHSAMSQTAAAMRTAGLVEDARNTDRRTRRIGLTAQARELLPLLKAEWQATEATVRDLEQEIPYPLSQVVEDIRAALGRQSFRARLRRNLAEALDGNLR